MGLLKPTDKTSIFFKSGEECFYKRKGLILKPEDDLAEIFYIEKGNVKAYSLTPTGAENIYLFLGEGDIFPGRWQLADDGETRIFFEAINPVALRRKLYDDYAALIAADPQIAREKQEIDSKVINILARRIEILENNSGYARVVLFLLETAIRFGQKEGDGVLINLPMSHYDLAHSINLVRETTSLLLEKLERLKIISLQYRKLTILDLKKLENELIRY